jgi:cell division protein ZapA
MSDTPMQPIAVKILGKDYRIACAENEQETLIHSAQELDEQMKEIRDSGKVTGTDRIAVLVALNLAHELNQAQTKPETETNSNNGNRISIQLAHLRSKIENTLEKYR